MFDESIKSKIMKTRDYIIAIMSVVTLTANAQTYTPASPNDGAIQSQQIMPTGGNYNGTVYEPFSTTAPSEQSAVGASYSPSKAPSRPRRENDSDPFATNQDGGDKDPGSPIGDAMVPLMVMAAAMAGVVYLRRRRAIKAAEK
jgi:hypothetical protein